MSPIAFILLISLVASAHAGIFCGPNSTPARCENPCPKTCANYKNWKVHPCPAICRTGCNCNAGFVKDEKNCNACVLPKNCCTK